MKMIKRKAGIYIEPGRHPWQHEVRIGEILALAGHSVEFLAEGRLPTADVRIDDIEYEIKSPEHFNPNTLEHTLRNALKQSPNIIIDTSRIKKSRDYQVERFLIGQARKAKRLKRLLMVTKQGQIIDIFKLL